MDVRASTGLRMVILAVSGLLSFTLSQYVLRETTPEVAEDGVGVNIHSRTELLQLLPGLGDIDELSGASDNRWMDGFGNVNLYDCLPSLNIKSVDIAPPYIEAEFTMESGSMVAVEFGRIAPADVQKAQDSLHKPKEPCSETGSVYGEYGSRGLWTFAPYPLSPMGNASLAYKYNYEPDATEGIIREGRVVYTISNGWGMTAITDEASGEALNSLLPRILASLDKAVGTKFLR